VTSVRKSVAFTGLLKGQGHEAECTVTAVEVRLPGTDAVAHTRFGIHSVSKKLPAGKYQLHVNGGVQDVQQTAQGFWIAA